MLEKIRASLEKDYIKLIFVFLFFFSIFSFIYFSSDKFTSLDDQFFNIRYAEVIKENGLSAFNDFHWLHFSKISEGKQVFSYNFLFYIALIPFTLFSPLFLGIKFFAVLFASLSLTALYCFLNKLKIKWPFFWVTVFFAIAHYAILWKLLMARSFTIAPIIIILEIYFLHKKKYWLVFATSVFYFFWHFGTFFLPLSVALIYLVLGNLYKKTPWKAVASTSSALVASLILSVYVTSYSSLINLFNTMFSIFSDLIFGKSASIAQGIELDPIDFFSLFERYPLLITLLIISIIYEIASYISRKRKDEIIDMQVDSHILRGTLFCLSILFLLGTLLSGRNEIFFVFFSFAYIALSFDSFLPEIIFKSAMIKNSFQIGIIIFVFYAFVSNALNIENLIATTKPHDRIESSAEWLKDNTEEGEVVFFPTMNYFTTMFYYDTRNSYIIGAEPKLLYEYNPKLYWAWWNISMNGFLCLEEKCIPQEKELGLVQRRVELKDKWYEEQGDQTADFIKKYFKSRFILTSKEFPSLTDLLENSDRFEKVFTDTNYNQYYVFKIKE